MAVFNRQQPDYYGDFMQALEFVPDPVILRDSMPQDGLEHKDAWGTVFCFYPSISNGCCFRKWNNDIYMGELATYGRIWAKEHPIV